MITNDTLLAISLFTLYLCIAWEIFDHFSSKVIQQQSQLQQEQEQQ